MLVEKKNEEDETKNSLDLIKQEADKIGEAFKNNEDIANCITSIRAASNEIKICIEQAKYKAQKSKAE